MLEQIFNKFMYPCEVVGQFVETKLVELLAKFEGKLEWM